MHSPRRHGIRQPSSITLLRGFSQPPARATSPKILKSDKSCISKPKSEISNWTVQCEVQSRNFEISDLRYRIRPISNSVTGSERSPPAVDFPRTRLLGCCVGRFSRPRIVEQCYRQGGKRLVVLRYF